MASRMLKSVKIRWPEHKIVNPNALGIPYTALTLSQGPGLPERERAGDYREIDSNVKSQSIGK